MAIETIGDDETPLIYGLEFQSRALTSHGAPSACESSAVRFAIGTQSLKNENQIHLLEFVEESHTLSKAVFRHPLGEVWHLSSAPKHPNLIASAYSSQSSTHHGRVENYISIFKFPIDVSTNLIDEESVTVSAQMEKLCDLNAANECVGRVTLWHPEEGNRILSLVNDNKLLLWDVESHKLVSTVSAEFVSSSKSVNRQNKITTFRWSPHFNCSLIGIASGNSVYAKDLRSKSTLGWSIPNAHGQLVRDADFNPNAQYYLATCGDDCESRFWDVRNTKSPVLTMLNHSHWVWSIRYNLFHDQLLLTSSSDSRVMLLRIATIASQPFGHILDVDDDADPDDDDMSIPKNSSVKPTDAIIETFEEHEDSVYAAEWSNNDPWIFASLSYDGRVVINKVPKTEKFNILF